MKNKKYFETTVVILKEERDQYYSKLKLKDNLEFLNNKTSTKQHITTGSK